MHDELTALRVEWPDTPDIASAVAARLQAAPAPRGRQRLWQLWQRPAWQLALAAVLAVVVAVAAIPPARSAVLDWLGFSSVRIERREPLPPAFPQLDLGERVSLEEARRRAPWLLLPGGALREPDAIFVAPDLTGGVRVSLVYRPRPGLPRADETGAGLLVTEFQATVTPVIQKSAGRGVRIERLRVGDDPAYFLSGAPHGFAYAGRRGANFEDQRLAGNTLLVERSDGVLLRIEGKLTRERAAGLARSFAP
jgi:hypothetical protein